MPSLARPGRAPRAARLFKGSRRRAYSPCAVSCAVALCAALCAGSGTASAARKGARSLSASRPTGVSAANIAVTAAPPAVVSVSRANANPALPNQSVAFNVAFSEPVTGVDASDFALARTGANTDSAITNVSGSGQNYSVTVSTGAGSGSVRLDVLDDDSITDADNSPLGGAGAGNGAFTAGPAYTVFPTPARGLSIQLLAPSNAGVTEGLCNSSAPPVAGASARTGTSAAGKRASAASDPPPVVTLTCAAQTGVNINNFQGVAYALVGASDFLLAGSKDSSYATHTRLATNYGRSHIDGVAVIVNSRERMSYNADDDTFSYGTKPINFPRADGFTLTFQFGGYFKFTDGGHFTIVSASGVVTNVAIDDLTLPDLLPASDTGASASDNYTTVNTNLQFALPYALRAPGEQFDLLRDGAAVSNASADQNGDATLTDPGPVPDGTHAYTIRRHSDGGITTALSVTVFAAPYVASITRAGSDPVDSGAGVNYTVTFSEPVTGVDATDFALSTTGTIQGAHVTNVSADAGATRTVTVSAGTGAGALRLDLVDDNTIQGAGSKPLGGPAAGDGDYSAGESYNVAEPSGVISGRVTAGGSPLGGVRLALSGAATGSTSTAPDGSYSFSHLTAGDYTVTPSRPSFSFTQTSRGVSLVVGQVASDTDFVAGWAGATSGAGGPVMISEFRLRGPVPTSSPLPADTTGASDEFVELYNNSDSAVDISGYTLDTSAGPAVTVPANSTIPPRGHFLVANSDGYTLSDYGGANNAAPDLTYSGFDIPDSAGLALLDATNRVVDAVGFANAPAPYTEGAALAPVGAPAQHSFVRRLTSGTPQDTGDNAADFLLVAADGDQTLASARLGAPGPENLSSPTNRGSHVKPALFDPAAASSDAPNRARFGTAVTNGAHGTLVLRRTFTNNTGEIVRRLRFRVVDITTAPQSADGGMADLRLLDTTGDHATTSAGYKSWVDMKVETPPAQALGGGYNSTALATLPDVGLGPGHQINIQFTLGVEQAGSFRVFVIVEALTDSSGAADPGGSPAPAGFGAPKGSTAISPGRRAAGNKRLPGFGKN